MDILGRYRPRNASWYDYAKKKEKVESKQELSLSNIQLSSNSREVKGIDAIAQMGLTRMTEKFKNNKKIINVDIKDKIY